VVVVLCGGGLIVHDLCFNDYYLIDETKLSGREGTYKQISVNEGKISVNGGNEWE